MDILSLRYFITVAELCNITRAAERHHIPQPAMSRTIKKLEQELNAPLFSRTNNHLALTRAGEEFYQSVRCGIALLDGAAAQARSQSDRLRGEIHLLAEQHRLNVLDCVAAFRRLYPDVAFIVAHSAAEMRGDADFTITSRMPPTDGRANGRHLLDEEIKIAVSDAHPLAQKARVYIDDLREESFYFTSRQSGLYEIIANRCAIAGFAPRIGGIYNDLYCIERSVTLGYGVAPLPTKSWRLLFQHGARLLSVADADLRRSTFITMPRLPIIPPANRVFYDFICEYFEKLPDA